MFFLSLFWGCDDHKFSGGHHSGSETTGEGYAAVQSVFSNNCTNCHATGATFPPLDSDLCNDIVDVDSLQSTMNKLVLSGDTDASYLYHKIVGTHLDVGGTGSQMPIGGGLSQSDIDIVASWISDGATCSASSEPSGEPSDDSGNVEPSGEPSDDSGSPEPSEEPQQELAWTDIEPQLESCVGCHSSTYPQMTYDGLVSQDSQQSSMKLIDPGDADNSYFLHKVSGTHIDAGGAGSQMPLGASPLSSEDLMRFEVWIQQGAVLELSSTEPSEEPIGAPEYTASGFCDLYDDTCGEWGNSTSCEDWYNAAEVGSFNSAGNPTDQTGVTQSCFQYHLIAASTQSLESDTEMHCGHVGVLDEADARCYDSDGDGTLNYQDAFHLDGTETTDTDEDGLGDNSDPDIEGDGICDVGTTAAGGSTSVDDNCDGVSNAAESFCLQYTDTCGTWDDATSCEDWFDAAEPGSPSDTSGATQSCYQHHLDIASSGATANPEEHCEHAIGAAPCVD